MIHVQVDPILITLIIIIHVNISNLKNTPHKGHLSVFTQNVSISIYTIGVFKYLKVKRKKYLKVLTQKSIYKYVHKKSL